MLINPLKSNGFALISRTSPCPTLGTFCYDFLSISNKIFLSKQWISRTDDSHCLPMPPPPPKKKDARLLYGLPAPPVAWAAVRSKAVVLLLLTLCLLLLSLWEFVSVLYFFVCYFMSILVLQSSWWGRESWLFCLICLPGVSWLLCGSFSRCHGVVCGLLLWYFLIILTYYFLSGSYKGVKLPLMVIRTEWQREHTLDTNKVGGICDVADRFPRKPPLWL